MLVLTRKLGEKIKIGDKIFVTVLEVRSGQVKIGIDAPKEVQVDREEVSERRKVFPAGRPYKDPSEG